MPTKTTISIISKNNQLKKVTDNINYVNPNISDAIAIQLAQKINALTDNTYDSTERTDKRNLDDINQRVFTTLRYGIAGSANTNFTCNIINLTTSQLNNAKVISASSGYNRFHLGFYPYTEGPLPFCEVESSIGMGITPSTASYPQSRWANNGTSIQIVTEDYANDETFQPQDITVKVTFPAYGGYDEWSDTFIFRITEG